MKAMISNGQFEKLMPGLLFLTFPIKFAFLPDRSPLYIRKQILVRK